jgi:hypothetical protein
MALNCALTQDYSFGCDVGAGGTKECYIIELNNISSITESSGVVSAITKVGGAIFRKYQLVPQTAVFDEAVTGNDANGTLFYTPSGTIVINKQQVNMRNEIMLLALNRLVFIIHDNNDTYRLYGRTYGLKLTTGTASTGAALGDRNGYSLTFTGFEPALALFVQPSVIATLQTAG